MKLQLGYQATIRFPEGKLRVCNVEGILFGGWISLRPQHSKKGFVLNSTHEILDIRDRSGALVG